jgi:hypothetical protein
MRDAISARSGPSAGTSSGIEPNSNWPSRVGQEGRLRSVVLGHRAFSPMTFTTSSYPSRGGRSGTYMDGEISRIGSRGWRAMFQTSPGRETFFPYFHALRTRYRNGQVTRFGECGPRERHIGPLSRRGSHKLGGYNLGNNEDFPPSAAAEKFFWDPCGGQDGIRTHETLLGSTPLAGERLRPLGHLPAAEIRGPGTSCQTLIRTGAGRWQSSAPAEPRPRPGRACARRAAAPFSVQPPRQGGA